MNYKKKYKKAQKHIKALMEQFRQESIEHVMALTELEALRTENERLREEKQAILN